MSNIKITLKAAQNTIIGYRGFLGGRLGISVVKYGSDMETLMLDFLAALGCQDKKQEMLRFLSHQEQDIEQRNKKRRREDPEYTWNDPTYVYVFRELLTGGKPSNIAKKIAGSIYEEKEAQADWENRGIERRMEDPDRAKIEKAVNETINGDDDLLLKILTEALEHNATIRRKNEELNTKIRRLQRVLEKTI